MGMWQRKQVWLLSRARRKGCWPEFLRNPGAVCHMEIHALVPAEARRAVARAMEIFLIHLVHSARVHHWIAQTVIWPWPLLRRRTPKKRQMTLLCKLRCDYPPHPRHWCAHLPLDA